MFVLWLRATDLRLNMAAASASAAPAVSATDSLVVSKPKPINITVYGVDEIDDKMKRILGLSWNESIVSWNESIMIPYTIGLTCQQIITKTLENSHLPVGTRAKLLIQHCGMTGFITICEQITSGSFLPKEDHPVVCCSNVHYLVYIDVFILYIWLHRL